MEAYVNFSKNTAYFLIKAYKQRKSPLYGFDLVRPAGRYNGALNQ